MMKNFFYFCLALILCFSLNEAFAMQKNIKAKNIAIPFEEITLGGGCFWCLDAIFQEVKGVTKVESGYAGGSIANPSYEDVCSGRTGHAEVIQKTFNPAQISL
jgi:hypothetical protein